MRKKSPTILIGKTWQPPDPLRVDYKDPNYAYRWVKEKNLEQKKYEGWVPVDRESGKEKYANPDGAHNDSFYHYRESILCKMPRDMARERNKFYRDRANKSLESAKTNFRKEANRMGIETFEE